MFNVSWPCALVASLALFGCASQASDSTEPEDEIAQATSSLSNDHRWWGRERVDEVAPGSTSVPLDSDDQALLAASSNFRDDGKVNRSLLQPALISEGYTWSCQQRPQGPVCSGTGINAGSWQEWIPCDDGYTGGEWFQQVVYSIRYYNNDSKITSKDIHFRNYDLFSQNVTGGGRSILGVGDYIVHEEYTIPGNTGQGTQSNRGAWENAWQVGRTNDPPVYINQGVTYFDQASGGPLTGNWIKKEGRWDWNTFDDLLAINSTKICPILEGL